MASTVVGASGRVYVQGDVLQRDHRTNEPRIFKAACGNQSYVYKQVSPSFYALSEELATEFAGSRRLRMHVDANPDERILFYPYFRSTLLGLIKDDPDLAPPERMKILRAVAEAIHEMHSNDWIHIDIKPDNILVDWTCDESGKKTVTNAVLGDFDIALKLKEERPLYGPHAIGNVMWRSPEGQTGRGVAKPSDMYSFGLVAVYTFGGGELLVLDNYRELAEQGISAEQEVAIRHFCYFEPVTEGLLKQIDSKVWSDALNAASSAAEKAVEENPGLRFEQWGADLNPEAQSMISGLTRMDPAARLTIDEVLKHPWWDVE